MTHIIEPAASGRSRCRGCKRGISRGELRFGERLQNPFADGDMTLWFHVQCAAFRRPDSLAEVLDEFEAMLIPAFDMNALREQTKTGVAHPRLSRIAGAERAPSGRARCRACREPIARDDWRIRLEFYEEGSFNPSGNIHLACAGEYFETSDVIARIRHLSQTLTDEDVKEIAAGIR